MEIRAYHFYAVFGILLAGSVLYSVVLEILAVAGTSPFEYRRGFYGIDMLDTCMMPPRFYPIVSLFVYVGLIFIAVYALVTATVEAERKDERRRDCKSMSIPYLVLLVISVNLYTGVLFSEDSLNASLGFIFSLLLLISNCLAMAYASYNFYMYGKDLCHKSISDFYCNMVLVNATAVYLTWTLVHWINSFSGLLINEGKSEMVKVCMGMLVLLLILMVLWFIIENTFLIYVFNSISLHYLVLVWYFATLYSKEQYIYSIHVKALMITDLVLAVVAFILRNGILIIINQGNKLYMGGRAAVVVSQDAVAL